MQSSRVAWAGAEVGQGVKGVAEGCKTAGQRDSCSCQMRTVVVVVRRVKGQTESDVSHGGEFRKGFLLFLR